MCSMKNSGSLQTTVRKVAIFNKTFYHSNYKVNLLSPVSTNAKLSQGALAQFIFDFNGVSEQHKKNQPRKIGVVLLSGISLN